LLKHIITFIIYQLIKLGLTFSLHSTRFFAANYTFMFKSYIQVLFFLSSLTFLTAQTGTIGGTIIDGSTKETIIGANVFISSDLGATSDFDGFYVIRNIPQGIYEVTVTSIGYETILVKDVKVESGKQTELNIVVKENSLLLNEVVITDFKKTNTEAAVMLEVKAAKQVISGVSSQQIQKSQDNNAAQVAQRVPGVTIVENRFVMIRGLSERYNNVMINNVIAPSTEVDKRTFSFDMVSSSSLDKMLIFKSGSADNPGDFAGGVIKLYTIDNVDRNFTRLNLGIGYRMGTSFGSHFMSDQSSTDFLGFDSGFRAIPDNFPSTRVIAGTGRNSEIRREAAHSLPNNFNPTEGMAGPDYSVGLSFGRNIDLRNGRKLSTTNNINYSKSYQYFERDFFRYFEWEDRTMPILKRFEFIDDTYQEDVRISILSNWVLRLNDRNRVKLKNLFNQIGENETIIRNGFDFIQRPNDDLRNYLLGYRSRSIYTGQLEGEHDLSGTSSLRWVSGFSLLRELEPDLRRFRTYRPFDQGDQNFIIQLPPSSNLFETGRYYGDLFEYTVNHGIDYTKTVAIGLDAPITLKTGYYADFRNRSFDSRYFSYLYPGFFDPNELRRLERLPLDQLFSNENIRTVDGFVLEEGTRPIDSYSASNLLGAGYVHSEIPLNNLNVNAGVRVEYNRQTMDSRDDFQVISVVNPITSFLPFINLGYQLSPKSLLRLGYGRTVNRPEFRELAPFLFYDYKLEAGRVGNPNLRIAVIDNIDLRYEFYPRNGETVSLGLFYKYFTDPIENRTIITTEQPQFTFINADFAQNYGAEIEVRKSFKGVTNSAFLDRFSINMNASLIFSEVDLGSTAVAQDRVRPLQGQSPYIINVALYYEDESGLSISLIYNRFGDRIYSVGDVLFPTIFELPRNSMDISIRKNIGDRISYKLGIQDVFNAPFRFFQDSDRSFDVTKDDDPIFTFRRGQLINLSASYKLF
jgi:hypothetical protein